MSELEEDLRSVAASMADDARRLQEIEQVKATMTPGDTRLLDLSQESERLARGLVPKAVAERELAESVVEAPRPTTDPEAALG